MPCSTGSRRWRTTSSCSPANCGRSPSGSGSPRCDRVVAPDALEPDALEVERVITDPGHLPRRRPLGGHRALPHHCAVLAGMLLLVLLAACSGSSDPDSSSTSSGPAGPSGGTG